MNGQINRQRRLAIGIGAILLLLAWTSAAVAQDQLIPGKIFVLKADKKSGGVKLIFKAKAEMRFFWFPCFLVNGSHEVQILLDANGSTFHEITVPVSDSPMRCSEDGFAGSIDDGRCKVKWKLWENVHGVEYMSSLRVKCVIPELAFSPMVGASFIFLSDSFGSVRACFIDPVLGLPNSAVVKKDGSDGKTFKMVDAPLAACEEF